MTTSKLRPHQLLEAPFLTPFKNVYHLFSHQVSSRPDKNFLTFCGEQSHSYSYQAFNKDVDALASYLQECGINKGECVNIIFPNCPQFLLFYFALFKLGAIIVPINPEISGNEMLYIIQNCSAKRVFCLQQLEFKLKEVSEQLINHLVEFVSDDVNFSQLTKGRDFENNFSAVPTNIDDTAVIIYTSGTTGNPKGVVLNHQNLLSDAKAICDWFSLDENSKALGILPLFHNNGQIVTMLAPLYSGGSSVITKGQASIMAFWGIVEKFNITYSSVMASIISILNNLKVDRTDKCMKFLICGGQVLTQSVQDHFEKRFNLPIVEGFGLTETTSFSCFNNYPSNKRVTGSIGKPLNVNEMAIIDENDSFLGPNQTGEIVIKGHNVATEYLGLTEQNIKSFRNQWFHSGDFGHYDDQGYFYFSGRKDFLIIKGGENIYPAEIENVLYQHDAVQEVAVIGVDDKLLGQSITAFVVLDEMQKISTKELISFCKGKLGAFKIPKTIIIINDLSDMDSIPKGPTKKVLYKTLSLYYEENYQ